MNAAMRLRGTTGSGPGRGGEAPAVVLDFIRPRLEQALRERKRYRYVHPEVLHEAPWFRVQSPCCSRNVDKDGGVIDIALLAPPGSPTPEGARKAEGVAVPEAQHWRAYARDHRAGLWVLHGSDPHLQTLLTLVCLDPQRVFWP